MPNKYKHDTERWLRSQASLYRACHNREVAEKFVLCADEVKRLKAELAEWQEKASEHADNSASATTELIGLRGELAALKEAVRLLIITTQPVLGEDGHLWTTEHAVDALAALVGEEGK